MPHFTLELSELADKSLAGTADGSSFDKIRVPAGEPNSAPEGLRPTGLNCNRGAKLDKSMRRAYKTRSGQ